MGSLYCRCDSSPESTSPLSLESSGSVLYITACNALHCAWWCKSRMHKALYALFLSYFEGGDLRLRQSRSLVCPDLRFQAEQVSELVVEVEVGTTIEEAWRTWPCFNTFQHFPFSSRCCLNTRTDAAFHWHPAHDNNNNSEPVHSREGRHDELIELRCIKFLMLTCRKSKSAAELE